MVVVKEGQLAGPILLIMASARLGDPVGTLLRLVLDFFIFCARYAVLAFVLFLVAYLVAHRWAYFRQHLTRFSPTPWRKCGTVACLGLVALFVVIAGWYLFLDGFAGEVEPVVSSLSWMVNHGHALYNDFGAAERYSVLYGPAVFLTNGLFLEILGPSLVSAKVASLLGVLGSLVFLYAALARRSRDFPALVVVALAVLYYWSQGFAVYLVRPDALLVFAVGLGIFAAVRLRPLLAVATVAAALGFALNLKVHAVVYFLPVLVLLVHRLGWRALWLAGSGAVFVTAAPFLFHPQVSIVNYLGWLRNAVGHGLTADTLTATLGFALFLVLPLLVLRYVCGPASLAGPGSRPLAAGLLPTFVLVLVLAAKPGAGLVHLLPLVPSTLYLVGRMIQDGWPDQPALRSALVRQPLRQGLVVAAVLTVLVSGAVNEYRAVKLLDWQLSEAPDLAADVKDVMARYPALTMAMACGGEDASFRHTWLRPLLVFANQPVLIDPVAVMDCRLSGKDLAEDTYAALADGTIKMWLVPRSKRPFLKKNWYKPHDPVFSSRFMEHFEAYYAPRASSRYFDLWFWKGLPAGGAVAAMPVSGWGARGNLLGP
jgi:hypothetical protein